MNRNEARRVEQWRGNLSVLLLAVLVLSCFTCAFSLQGTILNKTLLQQKPGAGKTILTTLNPRTVVTVTCRTLDAIVYDDPWWLKIEEYIPPVENANATSTDGWVADYDVNCGSIGYCGVPDC